jgi:hypothetical protein
VKLPSAEAESDMPGVENPFIREGPAELDGVGAEGRMGVSAGLPADCSFAGEDALTKIRVNSPGAGAAEGAGDA